jgi:hypothetical protein
VPLVRIRMATVCPLPFLFQKHAWSDLLLFLLKCEKAVWYYTPANRWYCMSSFYLLIRITKIARFHLLIPFLMHKTWHRLCNCLVCLHLSYHGVIWTSWTLTKFSLLLQYVIGRSDDDSKSSIIIKILEKLTQTWYCTSPFHFVCSPCTLPFL